MSSQKNYILEYYVSKEKFPEKTVLENYVKQKLEKFIEHISFEVKENQNEYLLLSISSIPKIIDACHDKLNVERDWAFRSKDELGDFIRKSSYPILSDIEITIRNFINQTLSEVLGFNWWDSFTPENIRKRVEEIEAKTGKSKIELQHQIEFTLFDDLLQIVTVQFQAWTDNHIITASELFELLSDSKSVEEIQKKLIDKRKIMSFWDNVFSNYFDDKDAWTQLKKKIENSIIPIRNKVMHHRLIRIYELKTLKAIRTEVHSIINSAKTHLSESELKETSINAQTMFDIITMPKLNYAEMAKHFPEMTVHALSYEEAMKNLSEMTVPTVSYEEMMKNLSKMTVPTVSYEEVIKNLSELAIPAVSYEEMMKNLSKMTIPTVSYEEMMKSLSKMTAPSPYAPFAEIPKKETPPSIPHENKKET